MFWYDLTKLSKNTTIVNILYMARITEKFKKNKLSCVILWYATAKRREKRNKFFSFLPICEKSPNYL